MMMISNSLIIAQSNNVLINICYSWYIKHLDLLFILKYHLIFQNINFMTYM